MGARTRLVGHSASAQGGQCAHCVSLQVAVRYAAAAHGVVMRFRTAGWEERGADIAFLSTFPAEAEILPAGPGGRSGARNGSRATADFSGRLGRAPFRREGEARACKGAADALCLATS